MLTPSQHTARILGHTIPWHTYRSIIITAYLSHPNAPTRSLTTLKLLEYLARLWYHSAAMLNRRHWCQPSEAHLANKLHVTRETIARCIARLRNLRLIKRLALPPRNHRYRPSLTILPPHLAHRLAAAAATFVGGGHVRHLSNKIPSVTEPSHENEPERTEILEGLRALRQTLAAQRGKHGP